MRIHLPDYVQNVDLINRVSISHWGMFPITIPVFHSDIEEDVPSDKLKETIFTDIAFGAAHMMRQMKRFKEEVAGYANKIS